MIRAEKFFFAVSLTSFSELMMLLISLFVRLYVSFYDIYI